MLIQFRCGLGSRKHYVGILYLITHLRTTIKWYLSGECKSSGLDTIDKGGIGITGDNWVSKSWSSQDVDCIIVYTHYQGDRKRRWAFEGRELMSLYKRGLEGQTAFLGTMYAHSKKTFIVVLDVGTHSLFNQFWSWISWHRELREVHFCCF